jgi:hypothetical protein
MRKNGARTGPLGEKTVTKEIVMTAIRESAAQLGHAPSFSELQATAKINMRTIRKHFGCYARALEECGLERHRNGYQLSMEELFVEWATIVRKLGKVPTIAEWEMHGKYSQRPLLSRFKSWKQVPRSLLEYAKKEGLEVDWQDVLDIMAAHMQKKWIQNRTFRTPPNIATKTTILTNQPIYGPALLCPSLTYAPTNEAGVLFLFGVLARELGYAVTRVQTEFPDCEAMRRVGADRLQRVRIELEYESRNFLLHSHRAEDCDLIVCWAHNWPECPLEVLELRTLVELVDRG